MCASWVAGIQLALEEPETTPFPPDEVLHLVRITTVILQQVEASWASLSTTTSTRGTMVR